jgi:hypothetical protein
MYWVNGLYTVTVNGVPQFQAANPGAGIPNGTEITYEWLNDVQGELLNFVTAAVASGIAPTANTPTQVKTATDFLYASKFNVLSAPKVIGAADRGYVFVCNPGTDTVTLPIASGFDAGFIVGLSGGANPTTVTVSDILNNGGALAGQQSFTLNSKSFVLLQAQGVNWGVLSASPDLQSGAARAQYTATQAASITPALNSTNPVCSQVVTFPSYSPSGKFRVLIRALSQGAVTGTNQDQNFTTSISDGTVTLTGAPWLVAVGSTALATWGVSDTFLSDATYAPGATITFNMSVGAAGGTTGFTINGCSMLITVEPA